MYHMQIIGLVLRQSVTAVHMYYLFHVPFEMNCEGFVVLHINYIVYKHVNMLMQVGALGLCEISDIYVLGCWRNITFKCENMKFVLG